MSMKQELAALKKKLDAGDINVAKYRRGVRQIKKRYGDVAMKDKVTKIFKDLTTPSPRSAKAVAARKKANERSDRQLISKAPKAKKTNTVTVSDAQKKTQTKTKKSDFLKGLDLTKNKTSSYKIKSGDTLSQIAKAKGTTVAALKKANNIKDVNKIRAGKNLTIPSSAPKTKNPYAGETKASMKKMAAKNKSKLTVAEMNKMTLAQMEAKLKKMQDAEKNKRSKEKK